MTKINMNEVIMAKIKMVKIIMYRTLGVEIKYG
jgi:hypothetical protein